MIGHECITFIAHSVLLIVNLAQSSLLFATILANCLTTAFAIVLKDHSDPAESLATKHAESGVELVDRVKIEYLR